MAGPGKLLLNPKYAGGGGLLSGGEKKSGIKKKRQDGEVLYAGEKKLLNREVPEESSGKERRKCEKEGNAGKECFTEGSAKRGGSCLVTPLNRPLKGN